MPSSKGKPTNPRLREEAKKEVLNMEKGGGKGSWSAWKAAEMSKTYEAKGGDYEETGDNPNKAKKGDPTPKKDAVEKGERKPKDAPVGEPKGKTKTASSTQRKTKGKQATQRTRQQPKRNVNRKVTAAA